MNWEWSDSQKAREIVTFDQFGRMKGQGIRSYYRKEGTKLPSEEIGGGNELMIGASRAVPFGSNPAILANLPLNRYRNRFRVKVMSLGKWIGIGIADRDFVLEGSKMLGLQSVGINASYFWQGDKGVQKIQMNNVALNVVEPLKVGTVISVYVNFESGRIFFYNNLKLEGWINSDSFLPEDYLLPCSSLSTGSSVIFLEESMPFNPTLWPESYCWVWSSQPERRGDSIILADYDTVVLRREKLCPGENPSVMAKEALTRIRSHFRVRVDSIGRWMGIGLCEESFQVTESKTLGTQPGSLNCSYFYQTSGICRLQMFGERCMENVQEFRGGDLIDVFVEFSSNRIHFFRNEIYQGNLVSTQFPLLEGRIFPCMTFSTGSQVRFINPPLSVECYSKTQDILNLSIFDEVIIRRKIREHESETFLKNKQKKRSHPDEGSWSWGSCNKKRSVFISVCDIGLLARRSLGGSNPAIMAREPFRRNQSSFSVKVCSMGSWIGIGIADSSFLLNGSKTLGEQMGGFNAGYFCQGDLRKLQMNGEKETLDVRSIETGDVVTVSLDFDRNEISFLNNGLLQGKIVPRRKHLTEAELFPCVRFVFRSCF